MKPKLRTTLNWLWLATPLGLAIARIGRCRITRGPRGLWVADGLRPAFPKATAFTVGNVVIFFDKIESPLDYSPGLLRHEEAHSTQWASFGPLFLPAYLLATGYSWLRTRDRATANWFEVRAGLADGGYFEPADRH